MAYRRCAARVERRRALPVAALVKANQLRLEANLPLRDIDKVVAAEQPLLTQEAYLAKRANQRAFARFRRERLAKLEQSTPHPDFPDETDWQTMRALAYRRAFLEHELQQAWLLTTKADHSRVQPLKAL